MVLKGFPQAYIRTKARRYIHSFLDGIGDKAICTLIDRDRNLLDVMPEEAKARYLELGRQYAWAIRALDTSALVDDIEAHWASQSIREHPEGKAWLYRQLDSIKEALAAQTQ